MENPRDQLLCLQAWALGMADKALVERCRADERPRERLLERAALSPEALARLEQAVDASIDANGGNAEAALHRLKVLLEAEVARTIASSSGKPAVDPATAEVTAEQPGRYTVLGEQGHGGTGRVLIVRDKHIGREIALKELFEEPGEASSSVSGSARLLQEARITAQLEHPSIVPVYEVGRSQSGRLYYTMRLVRGRTLAEALHGCESLEKRLELLGSFWDICNAVAFAHSRGVLHRDLKPQNVMVGPFGETLILDWGLAKAESQRIEAAAAATAATGSPLSTTETLAGSALGTPAYMSPEQALGGMIDQRSDVWGLGAVLYEILAGRPPFQALTATETLRAVVETPLTPARSLAPGAPPELAAIAERALQKEPARRYQSAQDLASDVSAFMTGGRVRAHSYSSWELLKRFAAQNKAALAAAGAVLAVILAALVLVSLALSRETKAFEREQAARAGETEQRLGANYNLALGYLEKAQRLASEQRHPEAAIFAAASLLHNPAEPGSPFFRAGFAEREPEAWLFRVRAKSRFALSRASSLLDLESVVPLRRPIHAIAVLTGGSSFAAATENDVTVFDRLRGATRALKGHTALVYDVAASPDGRWIASASRDGSVRIWDAASGEGRVLSQGSSPVSTVVFASGEEICAGDDSGEVGCWDRAGRALRTWKAHALRVVDVVASPGGILLASAGDDGKVRLFDLKSGEAQGTIGLTSDATKIAFAPDGRSLAVGDTRGGLALWSLAGEKRLEVAGARDMITVVTFLPDTRLLAFIELNGMLHVASEDGREIFAAPVGFEHGHALATTAAGELLTGDFTGLAKIWRISPPAQPAFAGHREVVWTIAWSPDGTRIAAGSWDGRILLWDARTGRLVSELVGHREIVSGLVFSPDGAALISASRDGTVRGWKMPGGEQAWVLQPDQGQIFTADLTPDGKMLGTLSERGSLCFWDLQTRRLLRQVALDGWHWTLAFSPDGALAAVGGRGESVSVVSTATGERKLTLGGHQGGCSAINFSSDGRLLLTGMAQGTTILWDLPGGNERLRLEKHASCVNEAVLSQDGAFVVTSSDDRTVRFWRADTGKLVFAVSTAKEAVDVALAPDGRSVAVADGNDVRIYPFALADEDGSPQELLAGASRAAGLELERFVLEQAAVDAQGAR